MGSDNNIKEALNQLGTLLNIKIGIIQNLANNEGWVSVGTDHDTSEFAVNSIRKWWEKLGTKRFPNAKKNIHLCLVILLRQKD